MRKAIARPPYARAHLVVLKERAQLVRQLAHVAGAEVNGVEGHHLLGPLVTQLLRGSGSCMQHHDFVDVLRNRAHAHMHSHTQTPSNQADTLLPCHVNLPGT